MIAAMFEANHSNVKKINPLAFQSRYLNSIHVVLGPERERFILCLFQILIKSTYLSVVK